MRAARARWSTIDMAASLAISAVWHLLVLAVLVITVHPFTLPEQRPILVELAPPLPALEPLPPVEVQLRPRAADVTTPPTPPVLPKIPEVRPLPVVSVPPPPTPPKPAEVKPLPAAPAAPPIPEETPGPLDVARPAPAALQAPVEVQRAAPVLKRPLEVNRAAPALPAPAPESETQSTPAPAPPQVQVLTNEAVVKAPVEIHARDRAPTPTLRQTQPALPDIPAAGQGGGAPAAGQGGAAGGGGLRPYGEVNGGFAPGGLKGGLRTTLGCASPDTYRLTPEEREACLLRLGREGKDGPSFGPRRPSRRSTTATRPAIAPIRRPAFPPRARRPRARAFRAWGPIRR